MPSPRSWFRSRSRSRSPFRFHPRRAGLAVAGAAVAIAIAAAACCAVAGRAWPAEPARQDPWPLSWGRMYTQWLYQGKVDKLWARLGPDMRQQFGGSPKELLAFHDRLTQQLGVEQALLGETFVPGSGYAIYKRRATFSLSSRPVLVSWTFGEDGTIGGFVLRPEGPPPPAAPGAPTPEIPQGPRNPATPSPPPPA
jgi:hypothetical protein